MGDTAEGIAKAAVQPTPPATASKKQKRMMPHVPRFKFGSRFYYFPQMLKHVPYNFVFADYDQVESICFTFKNDSGAVVTLVPIVHCAHPIFWKQVDSICSMHDSVLMEGRYSPLNSPTSVVPPRDEYDATPPPEYEDAEGWEPNSADGFFQPFSWGVKDSVKGTVVHAGDKYDYERLPWWASVRYSLPIIGAYDRDKHCLALMHKLSESGYQSFAIPWGFQHMPVMATMLMRNGFSLTATSRIVVFRRIDGIFSDGWVRRIRLQQKTTIWWGRFKIFLKMSAMTAVFHMYIFSELPWSAPPAADSHWALRGQFHDYRRDMDYQPPSGQ